MTHIGRRRFRVEQWLRATRCAGRHQTRDNGRESCHQREATHIPLGTGITALDKPSTRNPGTITVAERSPRAANPLMWCDRGE
jgi:hypothetical protein